MSLQKLFKPLPSLSIRPRIPNPSLSLFHLSAKTLQNPHSLSPSDPKSQSQSQTQTPTDITTSEKEKMDRKYTQTELWAKRKERRKRSNDGEKRRPKGDGRDERTQRTLPSFNQVCRFKLGFWFRDFHWKVKVLIEQLQNYVKLENLKEL